MSDELLGWTERGVLALERIAAALEQQNVMLSSVEPPACLHPEDKRVDESTMGHPRWKCTDCGFAMGYEDIAGSVNGD